MSMRLREGQTERFNMADILLFDLEMECQMLSDRWTTTASGCTCLLLPQFSPALTLGQRGEHCNGPAA